MERGKLITLEGGESAGKTTQIKLMCQFLKEQGKEVLVSREPGGVELAEQIRQVLFGDKSVDMDLNCELLLFFAARAQIIKELVKPTLDAGTWLILDRYTDSTTVYQGYVKGANRKFINELNKYIVGEYMPDLTFYIDVPTDTAMARNRDEINRHDTADKEFHDKVRMGYLILAEKDPQRIWIVDGKKSIEGVYNDIINRLKEKLL